MPCAPVAPISPWAPVAPMLPWMPVAPVEPVGPVAPVRPIKIKLQASYVPDPVVLLTLILKVVPEKLVMKPATPYACPGEPVALTLTKLPTLNPLAEAVKLVVNVLVPVPMATELLEVRSLKPPPVAPVRPVAPVAPVDP